MIEVNDLNISIDEKPLLKDVSFNIRAGEIIRFVGPNGCGKTSLLETLLGLRDYDSGSIVKNFSVDEYGYLPQVAHQFPKIHLQFNDVCNKALSFYSEAMLVKNWHTSSGGERKKALIAKAISETSKILFLDEPFNHLDLESSKLVASELVNISNRGISILYIGHDFTIPGSKDYTVDKWMF